MADGISIERAADELGTVPALVHQLIATGDLPDPPTSEACHRYLEEKHRIRPGTLGYRRPSAR